MQLSDKFIPFFSVTPSKKFLKLFERAGIKNVLISYHYIKKDPVFTKDIMQRVRDWGGTFMVDSGIFSFIGDKDFDAYSFDWISYTREYTDWVRANKEYIFQACNVDADIMIGHFEVEKLNKHFFEPLEQDVSIFYVAHRNVQNYGELGIFKEYCKKYKCVAVNEDMAKFASDIYQIAKQNNTAIHGLAWTKPTILKDFPFFSVDSTSWVNYQKYGATIYWDGVNFQQYDKDNKDIRRTLKKYCDRYNVKFDEFCTEKNPDGSHNDDEGLTFSLCAWKETLESVRRVANSKLKNTIEDIMEHKAVEVKFETPQTKQSGLKAMLADKGLTTEAVPTEYSVDDEGVMVVAVKQRAKREDITVFKKGMGDSLFCNNCFIKDKCPKFQPDTTCGFDFSPNSFTENPMSTIDALISVQAERVNRAMLFETMEGGVPNKVYSQELLLLSRLNQVKADMIMATQVKGFKYTERTFEMTNGAMTEDKPTEEPKENKGGGFIQLLANAMKK